MADELNLDNEFPWPTEGDDPFKLTASARQLMACLNFTHEGRGRGAPFARDARGSQSTQRAKSGS